MAKISMESLKTIGEALQWIVDLDDRLRKSKSGTEKDKIMNLYDQALSKARRGLGMAKKDGFDFYYQRKVKQAVEGSDVPKCAERTRQELAKTAADLGNAARSVIESHLGSGAATKPVVNSLAKKG